MVGGFSPSEKYQSVGITTPDLWQNENVPNHQPGTCMVASFRLLLTPKVASISEAQSEDHRARAPPEQGGGPDQRQVAEASQGGKDIEKQQQSYDLS